MTSIVSIFHFLLTHNFTQFLNEFQKNYSWQEHRIDRLRYHCPKDYCTHLMFFKTIWKRQNQLILRTYAILKAAVPSLSARKVHSLDACWGCTQKPVCSLPVFTTKRSKWNFHLSTLTCLLCGQVDYRDGKKLARFIPLPLHQHRSSLWLSPFKTKPEDDV